MRAKWVWHWSQCSAATAADGDAIYEFHSDWSCTRFDWRVGKETREKWENLHILDTKESHKIEK